MTVDAYAPPLELLLKFCYADKRDKRCSRTRIKDVHPIFGTLEESSALLDSATAFTIKRNISARPGIKETEVFCIHGVKYWWPGFLM